MRTIAPEIFSDEFFGTLALAERVLWMGLLLICADDQGRLLDNSAMLRNHVFPFDDNNEISREMVEAGLCKFAHQGKIIRYSVSSNGSGKKLIQISNWWRYQKSASWMAASKFPPPEGWIDRCRYHTGGNQIVETNWKLPGGFLPSVLPSILPTPLPSREVEVKSRVEVDKESRVESIGKEVTDDDRVLTLTGIFKLIGIPQNYRNMIISIPSITREDVLAELTRNYSKKGSGKGKVREPGKITGMNLARCELPSAEWYDEKLWMTHLPPTLRAKLGIAVQSDEVDSDNQSLVAIRTNEVKAKVDAFLEGRS